MQRRHFQSRTSVALYVGLRLTHATSKEDWLLRLPGCAEKRDTARSWLSLANRSSGRWIEADAGLAADEIAADVRRPASRKRKPR